MSENTFTRYVAAGTPKTAKELASEKLSPPLYLFLMFATIVLTVALGLLYEIRIPLVAGVIVGAFLGFGLASKSAMDKFVIDEDYAKFYQFDVDNLIEFAEKEYKFTLSEKEASRLLAHEIVPYDLDGKRVGLNLTFIDGDQEGGKITYEPLGLEADKFL